MPFVAPASDKKATPQRGFVAPHQDHASGLSLSDLITGQRHVSTPMDMLRNFSAGTVEGVRSLSMAGLRAQVPSGMGSMINPHAILDNLSKAADSAHLPPIVGNMLRVAGLATDSPISGPPQTTAGRYARTIGQFAPNAVGGGGSAAARLASVVVPAVASETLGHAAQGTSLEGPARFVGALAGGVAAGARLGPRSIVSPKPMLANPAAGKGLTTLARKIDIPSTQTAAEKLRNLGINPTLVDVVGETGRGIIKSAASRQTPARDAVTAFYKGRREGLPDMIDRQSAAISPTARSADDIVAALTDKRSNQARTDYAAPYAQQVEVTPEVHSALAGPEGAAAIARAKAAASARRDGDMMQQLDELQAAVQHQFPGRTTGAALDRTQIALGQKGAALSSGFSPKRDIASGYFDRQADVNSALDDVPHLAAARAAFKETTRQMDAANTGADFMAAKSADEFAAAVKNMSPEAVAVAREAARRSVQMAAGERLGSAPGVADRLAHAPEQQARNAALLGPEGAARLQQGMEAAGQTVSNAFDVLPKGGSRTALNAQDAVQTAGEGARALGHAATGNWLGAGLGAAKLWLKTAGLNDADSEALAQMAIDPAQTDQAIAYLHSTLGPTKTQQFVEAVKQGAARSAPMLATSAVLATAPAQ